MDLCEKCGERLSRHVIRCEHCGKPCAFPNVRYASSAAEQQALEERYLQAYAAAGVMNKAEYIEAIDHAAADTVAVVAVSLERLQSFISGSAIIPFLRQVDSTARIPKDDPFESVRPGIEEGFFPHYAREINFAALSVDGQGVEHYGAYSIVLNTVNIEDRASILDENAIIFVNRHGVRAGEAGPSGYRSDWPSRNKVAVSKLCVKLGSVADLDLRSLFIDQGAAGVDADFIEVHVYGAVTSKAVAKVIGPVPIEMEEKAIFSSISRKLAALGIPFEAL